jgi:hypothetical protein
MVSSSFLNKRIPFISKESNKYILLLLNHSI